MYQVKTLRDGRVGFRIDNDTTLSSGTHVAGRVESEGYFVRSVEQLIHDQPGLANKPIDELIRDKKYQIISILQDRTRMETGNRGGGTLYETFYWTEKRACTWGEVWFGDPAADMQVWKWEDFKANTVDPKGWPSQ